MTGEPRFDRLDARYEIIEKIAQGGMGTIYRVHDHALGRTVAMKVCSIGDRDAARGTEGDRTETARFLDEARITARLDHPGIIPVHDLGTSPDGRAYFLMPLVRGQSLSEIFSLAKKGQDGWNVHRVMALLVRIAQTVAYAHSKGVIHRDLKPANVMVGRFGQVYVLDWGLAKVAGEDDRRAAADSPAPKVESSISGDLDLGTTARIDMDSPGMTRSGTVIGTPVYMSPEQAQGRVEDIDPRTDVYALGAMLYELLAGHPPYCGTDTLAAPAVILARVREGPPRALREIAPGASHELVAIVARAMAREPSARYANALELSEDLQAYLDHRVVAAYRTGPLARLRSWCRRHRKRLVAAAATALISAVGIASIDRVTRTRESREILRRAEAHAARFRELDREIPKLVEEWEKARVSIAEWVPAWSRKEEIESYRRLETARRELDSRFNSAAVDFSNVDRLSPSRSLAMEARASLAMLYHDRYKDIESGELIVLSPEYYRRQIETLAVEPVIEALDRSTSIDLSTDPPAARVYCFRYEECEDTRLVPMPFDPRTRTVSREPFLRVEKIHDARRHGEIFAAGDRIVTVRGARIRTMADLARSIHGIEPGGRVPVVIERRGSELELEWIPCSTESPSTMNDLLELEGEPFALHVPFDQLGLTFESYPLDFSEESLAGETRSDRPLRLELPKGSYLLVLRKDGYTDTRLPIVIPRSKTSETIRLLRHGDVPPGFVHVPAGPFAYGGDLHAFQSREGGEAEVDGLLIGRHEVTIGEYVEFLNDLHATGRFAGDPDSIVPESPAVLAEIAPRRGEGGRQDETRGEAENERDDSASVPAIAVVPRSLVARSGDGPFELSRAARERGVRTDAPVSQVSQLAAIEFAHWRTQRDPRFSYRLPTDLEWEKAARGADRRSHVWGEYLIWSFSWNNPSVWTPHYPPAVGLFSTDESVYGVRDLAGSVSEHTSSRISRSYASRRGGNWRESDSQNVRIATRNGRVPSGTGTETGFRLVAEL
ncbi:MAG TPA: SUMF1/EgtB/PvdO family nonheme iron enzyme, partial [Planctomycetota bacterium]|nr:SUMF1/EgtB/PvdO family nonheme iron enzyme [Planctomycetota bacterium]